MESNDNFEFILNFSDVKWNVHKIISLKIRHCRTILIRLSEIDYDSYECQTLIHITYK